jgi:hypothetical protein
LIGVSPIKTNAPLTTPILVAILLPKRNGGPKTPDNLGIA